MRVRIADKRKFRRACIIFTVFSAVMVSLVNAILGGGADKSSQSTDSKNKEVIALASSNDGNIFLEENEYFKKYIINCGIPQKAVNFEEDEGSVHISFENSVTLKLNDSVFSEDKKEEVYKKDKDSNVLTIKKLFPNNNFVYVDEENENNVVVLISKKENPFKYKVMIDPGHGGIDKGVNIGDIYEKDINLSIAKYMINPLIYNGCQVKLSREGDVLNALKDIAESANSMNADALVSIHINSFTDSKYSGVGTYYSDNGNNTSERIRLAKSIQNYAVKDDGWVDRGLFKDKLKLLNYSKVPCALVECGFLTNPSDRDKLTRKEPLLNLANNISKGILEFLENKE